MSAEKGTREGLYHAPPGAESTKRDGTAMSQAYDGEDTKTIIQRLLGTGVNFGPNLASGDVNYYTGQPHATTGLPYALSGTSTVINKKVIAALAGFQDPIRLILPTGVHKTKTSTLARLRDGGSTRC